MSSLVEISKKWEGRIIEGKFPLKKWLGGSERGAVFLTERVSGNGSQKAAIKLVRTKSLAEERLEEETALSRWADGAKLSHPHLLRLYESGRCQIENERYLYVVMEYAEEDLAQILPQRALSPEEVKELLPPTADALTFLHRAGFVHAHVKPSNVMAVNDQLKLSADHLRKSGDRNGRGVSVYDAPEVGSIGLSPAADVWSLGVMLVAVLTQHEPTRRNGGGGEPIVIPEKIPQPFHDIAERSLRIDPQRRCSMNEILSKVAGPELLVKPVSAPPPLPMPAPSPKAIEVAVPDSKRRSVWAIPLILIFLLLLIVVGRRLLVQKPSSAPVESRGTQSTTTENVPATPSASAPAAATEANTPAVNTSGAVLHQVTPDVSRGALNTIHGRIKVGVQVSVDAAGNVSQARLISAGPSKYFANKALAAARDWTFKPPQTNGQASPSKWLLRFQFGRSSTQVLPEEVKP